MSVVRTFTCDICGKTETCPDMTFGSDFPTPAGWQHESAGDERGLLDVCSRGCMSTVLYLYANRKLDRLYPLDADG